MCVNLHPLNPCVRCNLPLAFQNQTFFFFFFFHKNGNEKRDEPYIKCLCCDNNSIRANEHLNLKYSDIFRAVMLSILLFAVIFISAWHDKGVFARAVYIYSVDFHISREYVL